MATKKKRPEVKQPANKKLTCFIVCPIGGDVSPQRKHSDQALRHIIAPVLLEAGFQEPTRADKLSESGNITRQIIKHIREDSLVIADLTGHNPNVFYELAIRHCTGLPFIQMIKKGENIPFDLGPMRTIFFDLSDPDDVVVARTELERQVANAMADGAVADTPIGQAIDFEKLTSSGSALERMLSTLIESVEGLSNRPEMRVNNIRRDLLRQRVEAGDFQDGATALEIGRKLGYDISPLMAAEVQQVALRQAERLRAGGGIVTSGMVKDLIRKELIEVLDDPERPAVNKIVRRRPPPRVSRRRGVGQG